MMKIKKLTILTLLWFLVCERILASVSSVMTAVDVPFEILLHFIASLPREYTDIGGMSYMVVVFSCIYSC